jgi:hypothetical protein
MTHTWAEWGHIPQHATLSFVDVRFIAYNKNPDNNMAGSNETKVWGGRRGGENIMDSQYTNANAKVDIHNRGQGVAKRGSGTVHLWTTWVQPHAEAELTQAC